LYSVAGYQSAIDRFLNNIQERDADIITLKYHSKIYYVLFSYAATNTIISNRISRANKYPWHRIIN